MTSTDTPKADSAPADATSASRVHLAERLRTKIPEAIESPTRDGHDSVEVPASRWFEAATALRDDARFVRFIDVTCVDDPSRDLRFEVHLVVYSMEEKRWARLLTRTASSLASVVPVFAGAHNYEREVFDLFGVVFEGHPKLTRIMLPDGWQGHPLRRDVDMPVEPVDFTVTRDLYDT